MALPKSSSLPVPLYLATHCCCTPEGAERLIGGFGLLICPEVANTARNTPANIATRLTKTLTLKKADLEVDFFILVDFLVCRMICAGFSFSETACLSAARGFSYATCDRI